MVLDLHMWDATAVKSKRLTPTFQNKTNKQTKDPRNEAWLAYLLEDSKWAVYEW